MLKVVRKTDAYGNKKRHINRTVAFSMYKIVGSVTKSLSCLPLTVVATHVQVSNVQVML